MKKQWLLWILGLWILLSTLPFLSWNTGTSYPSPAPAAPTADVFSVLDCNSGKVVTLSAKDYIIGVLAAEMSPTNELEALKAQAVAAYSVAVYRRDETRQSPNPDNKGADLTTDPSKDQGYWSIETAKEQWGDHFQEYYDKLLQAVQAVDGQTVQKNGQTVFAAYCAFSSGKTESAKTVWGQQMPCLESVESVCDLLAPNYQTTKTVTEAEFRQGLSGLGMQNLPQSLADCVVIPTRSDAGSVTAYTIGEITVTGQQLRAAFGLRSANFDITCNEQSVTFTVRGYGHGVGMSQFGAQYMAQQGSNYREILQWYYPGATIAVQ